jgi:hypothetical protein
MSKIINLHDYSGKIPLPKPIWPRKGHEDYLKQIDKICPLLPNIKKHYFDCVKKNTHPDIFLSTLPKLRAEGRYELFYIYCFWWHYINCRKSRYKNCEELWIRFQCIKVQPDHFKMVKMFYYEINKPKALKCKG